MRILSIIALVFFSLNLWAQEKNVYWNILPENRIVWNVKPGQAHTDHIEISGLQVSSIINYGTNENGELVLQKKLVFPMLRTIPNNTHASLIQAFEGNEQPVIKVNGMAVQEFPEQFMLNGILTITSSTKEGVNVRRTIFPSRNKAALVEIFQLKNTSSKTKKITMDFIPTEIKTPAEKGVYGEYILQVNKQGDDSYNVSPSEEVTFALVYSGRKECEPAYQYSPDYELLKREKFLNELAQNLVLETPNDTINREFAFAKIRATESIYDTKGGLMHGPGGGAYYAAIWANDQAEYVDPFFPFLGNLEGNESAINSFRHFARYMNPEYKPIPSSIIAEGVDYWNGAGDRGDQAMIAYGASRFSLAYGSPKTAKELWPLIRWCLHYLELKKGEDGVIASDSDELEGRFPSGDYNLSTNVLAYGALVSASHLATELNKPDTAQLYLQRAKILKQAIESYFGANVQGFDTYQYYKGNDKLRSWICIPLTMGIFDRKDETIKALLSPYLWTTNGILTQAGSKTFWDRSTLYAFRGLFNSGATNRVMPYLAWYSSQRLLGAHVPYPVEAWPEGNQRHLSAESGLYCRVITEGLFGIQPTGFATFTMAPWLPEGWDFMRLKNIRAFGKKFDIEVTRDGDAEQIAIILNGKKVLNKKWDKKNPLEISL